MAFQIPRLQYRNLDTTGTTAASNGTITAIADTTDIEVGMFVRGTGIPTGALVGSKTSTTVVLASGALCTASATVSIGFGHEILFDYPPKEESGEILETKSATSESLSGVQQTSINYIEAKRVVVFSFLTPAIYALMDSFLRNSALLGEDFRYFEDKTSSSYVTYELGKLKVTPKKISPRSSTTYVWEVPLEFRRAL